VDFRDRADIPRSFVAEAVKTMGIGRLALPRERDNAAALAWHAGPAGHYDGFEIAALGACQLAMKSPCQLLRFPSAVRRDRAIDVWMHKQVGELGTIAQHWFEIMRDCGDDVRELLHDGHPTACVGDAAFAYVNAFTAHVNVGFFRGAELADPARLLEGTGKFMRHVKLRPGGDTDAVGLTKLIEAAYADMKGRLKAE
jgi:hypothetical protein